MPENRIGELLILNKLITSEQFEQSLEMQQLNPEQPIGQILCQMGFLKNKDLEYVLDHNNKRRKLGEILVSLNLINEERLKNALVLSQDEKIPIGRALIRQHLLEEEQLARAIALQHDLKFVNLAGIRFDPELSSFVSATFAQRLRIVPIRCRDNCLTIAMAYPIQRDELSQLESWCKMPIIPVIAKESDIIITQQKIFKISGLSEHAKLHFELTEDQERDGGKSKYVNDFISADVDYLTKRIITTGIKDGTSDIHLESTENGMVVRYRLDGILQAVDLGADDALISANARQIVSKIKILCDMDIAERRRPQDSSFKMKVSKEGKVRSVDFRVSTVPTQFGENVVIRILDKRSGAITLEGLGYFPADVTTLYRALDKPTGIFLVTGPTGSGKSSTLYAVLSHINNPGVKTLTIEDPIEYSIEGITQTEVNEIIGNSFARLLRAFLRQDPDNIMVGEIRDLETATISMRAALTGHTVLSTLHTNDATSAVTRLIDMGVEPSLISATLRCSLAQRLVRRICCECKVSYAPPEKLLGEFGIPAAHNMEFVQGKGCPACHYTGFNGRLPIVELWIPTREELLLLNRRPDNLSLRNAVFSVPDRLTMIDDGFRRVQAGETTLEELLRTVPYEQIEAGRGSIARKLAAPGASWQG
ncbi:MAG: GspE/PulE family protein [Geobacteraceae bacterium]|nr:GspE/PulE family protein [Geobacteraceae bacterium]